MAKTFAVMKTNVGAFIQDTSSQMATLIGKWIIDHYRDVARRGKYSAMIDFTHTITTVVGTATYDLPADFEQEIFVGNITDGFPLTRMTEGEWFTNRIGSYSNGVLQNGNSDSYVILESSWEIMLDPPPDQVRTIAMPYKKQITELSGDSDEVEIPDTEVMIEFGAIGEALAYKKQYQKADYYFQRKEAEFNKRNAQEKAKINQMMQRVSAGYRVSNTGRLTGDVPYAS